MVSTQCTAGHRKVWSFLEQQSSQDWNGNIAIAASILISGSSYQPFRDAMDIAKVKMFSKSTFFTIQNRLLFPAINNVYQSKRHEILERTKKSKNICLVGDGRCDSPGFSAMYGTYTLMNEINNEIIDFFTAHVRNAGNSQNMEKYGLKCLLDYLTTRGLNIDTLTTDQHIQIRYLAPC